MKGLMLLALVAATAAIAGPYDEPYSIITTDTAPSADPLLRPIIVNRVNDETVGSDNRAVVPPGTQKVTVDLPRRKGFKIATQRTFELVTRPCMRYFVVAKLDNPTGQEWKPVVRSSELIGECQQKFRSPESK
jgi:cytochrome c1